MAVSYTMESDLSVLAGERLRCSPLSCPAAGFALRVAVQGTLQDPGDREYESNDVKRVAHQDGQTDTKDRENVDSPSQFALRVLASALALVARLLKTAETR